MKTPFLVLFPTLAMTYFFTFGCEAEKAPVPTELVEPKVELTPEFPSTVAPRRVLGSPLILPAPTGWIFERTRPPAIKDDETVDADAPIRLRSHTLFSARADKQTGAAWLIVMHDNNLGSNTTASEYLDAQRASNRRTVVNIKHVDAERSVLNGRPTYRVRDEWELNGEVYVQDSLLVLDQAKGKKTKDGYAIVFTQKKDEAPRREGLIKNLFAGVRVGE